MKKYTYAFVVFVLFLLIGAAHNTAVKESKKVEKIEQPPVVTLTRPQRAWLGALEWCESRGVATAVNPKDRDNTPSYGLLHFKPSTLALFEKQYGITGDIMNPDTQEKIVEQMILRGGIDWHQQFPECTRKLGLPPHLST